jgi:hypothetical protein
MNHTPPVYHGEKCGTLVRMKTYTCRTHGPCAHYEYLISTTGRRQRTCKLCRSEEVKRTNARLRLEIIAAYGQRCECCGEAEPRFLTIDHIRGNGQEDKRNIGSGNKLYRSLKRRGFPRDGLRLLCYNCNCARGQFGVCPHEERT